MKTYKIIPANASLNPFFEHLGTLCRESGVAYPETGYKDGSVIFFHCASQEQVQILTNTCNYLHLNQDTGWNLYDVEGGKWLTSNVR